MELNPHEPAMVRKLHDLGQVLGRRAGADHHARFLKPGNINVIDFVAMPMTLVDFVAVNGLCLSAGAHRAALRALAHGAPQIGGLIALFAPAFAILPFRAARPERTRGRWIDGSEARRGGKECVSTCRSRGSR